MTQGLFGTWKSPLSPQAIGESLRFNDVQWDTLSETLVWSESRDGRGILMAQAGVDAPLELTDSSLSVKGRVGYGGGDFTVHNGIVYFAAGRLYRVSVQGGAPRPITPAFGSVAAPTVSPDGRWLVYASHYSGRDGLALVDTEGATWPRQFIFGNDFIMQPAWHPAATHLAYIVWDHPSMPWDGTELRLATLEFDRDGVPHVESVTIIAGDPNTSIFQPAFSPDGRYLSYISDAPGYWQIFLYDLDTQTHTMLTDVPAEHGRPAWLQGMRTMAWESSSQGIVFLRNTRGYHTLHHLDLASGSETTIDALEPYTALEQISVSPEGRVAVLASAPTLTPRILSYGQAEGVRIHRRSSAETIQPSQLVNAEPVEWIGEDGEPVYGLLYLPQRDRANQRDNATNRPPLIVLIHGGPSSQKTADYKAEDQFFATRGYAVLYVNHRGSTGYGKAYKDKLRGNWGVVDVQDAVSGAAYLAEQGLVDPDKRVIMGGSAGGYTVLQALVMHPGFFKAGVCRYGISNQFMLYDETHKFEARYNDSLIGTPMENPDVYRARSPLFHAEKITDALAIFQGADDNVVPKNQSDDLVAVLRARGVPHLYKVYEGEGHGFRKPETLADYYETVLKFLKQVVIYQ
ncbi:MAG: prolyl oligopeptidase family serine peptidase [Anaerolineae bacterium]